MMYDGHDTDVGGEGSTLKYRIYTSLSSAPMIARIQRFTSLTLLDFTGKKLTLSFIAHKTVDGQCLWGIIHWFVYYSLFVIDLWIIHKPFVVICEAREQPRAGQKSIVTVSEHYICLIRSVCFTINFVQELSSIWSWTDKYITWSFEPDSEAGGSHVTNYHVRHGWNGRFESKEKGESCPPSVSHAHGRSSSRDVELRRGLERSQTKTEKACASNEDRTP